MSGSLHQQPTSSTNISSVNLTETLISATSLNRDDNVVVIGCGAFDHLLELVRSGCNGAAAFRTPFACRGEDSSADVVWFVGVDAIDATIEAMVDHLDTPRAVAFEFCRTEGFRGGVASIVARLRANGFTDSTVAIVNGHPLVVALRPFWLRRVI